MTGISILLWKTCIRFVISNFKSLFGFACQCTLDDSEFSHTSLDILRSSGMQWNRNINGLLCRKSCAKKNWLSHMKPLWHHPFPHYWFVAWNNSSCFHLLGITPNDFSYFSEELFTTNQTIYIICCDFCHRQTSSPINGEASLGFLQEFGFWSVEAGDAVGSM